MGRGLKSNHFVTISTSRSPSDGIEASLEMVFLGKKIGCKPRSLIIARGTRGFFGIRGSFHYHNYTFSFKHLNTVFEDVSTTVLNTILEVLTGGRGGCERRKGQDSS